MEIQRFVDQFRFCPERAGWVGVEREYFLVRPDGTLAPDSPRFLEAMGDDAWTYELSGCQVEHRTPPCPTRDKVRAELVRGQETGQRVATRLGLELQAREVGPADMPFAIYPHNDRYAEIARTLPRATLEAACRVTGTHLHFGVRDIAHALRVHNALRENLPEFVRLGDHSCGERFGLYTAVAPKWNPPHYESPEHLFEVACHDGFVENPRNCWHMIRVSKHGTVELRAFGVTPNPDEILSWIDRAQYIISLS